MADQKDDRNNERMNTTEDLTELLQIRREKLDEMVRSGQNPFEKVRYDVTAYSADIIADFEKMQGESVSVAGRLMSKRGMGKVCFCDLHDRTGKIQLYVRVNNLEEQAYDAFKKLDIGDIVGVKGEVFRTKRGEISIQVEEYELLSKSLHPLPEKWHGLQDTDLRYRQRYLDLLVNPDIRKTFEKKSRIIRSIRSYLDERGYLEVETPVLNTIPGGAAARPFVTHHNALDMDLFLRISPELYLKRLIIGGLDKVYELGRMFRNEGISIKHNPEFTMLELYCAYADYRDMMKLCEDLIHTAAMDVNQVSEIVYQGETIDLKPPWERLSMVEAVRRYANVNFDDIRTERQIQATMESLDLKYSDDVTWGTALYEVFEAFAEEKLIQPTIIYDYPIEISPLTKKKPGCPLLTERFEVFIYGREIGNAYSELNDPIDQKSRFVEQVKKRQAGDEEANMEDADYIHAMEYGLAPTGGLGVGIDRLVMLLTDSDSIRDVIFFPTMRQKD